MKTGIRGVPIVGGAYFRLTLDQKNVSQKKRMGNFWSLFVECTSGSGR